MIRPFLCPGLGSNFSPAPLGADGRSHVDNLWVWALFMYERLVVRINSARDLATTHRMTRRYRRDYLDWLEPVERLVRCLIVTRAITWLTMTVEGRRALAQTPKRPPPGPQRPPVQDEQQQQQQQQQQHEDTYTPPDLTPEEIEARYLALPVPRVQTNDPATWICPFRVLRFDRSHPPSEDGWRGVPSGLSYEEIAALEYLPRIDLRKNNGNNHGPSLRGRRDPYSVGRKLARRVEALGRAIANAERLVRRTARLLARQQPGLIPPPDPPLRRWMQGEDANRAAMHLTTSALNTLNRVEGLIPEPG